jgi:ABC-type uncharacterized transport system involved in gliding motility auxiliary subunit
MRMDWVQKRQTKYTAYAVTYILVIVAVLGAANFLANRYNKSYDSTANKQFSLSDQTVKVVKNLKKDVNVTYFDETSRFPQARDLLGRYQTLSNKLHVNYIDPVRKPQVARAAGYRRDSPILVDSGVRKEEAKSLTEEEVTGALIRSLKSGERNACFLSGSGEHSLDETGSSGYSSLKAALEKNNYKTRTITPTSGIEKPKEGAAPQVGQVAQTKFEVPKDCTVLVVAGPKTAYTGPEVDGIKNYVENGGRALIMLDTPVQVGRRQEAADSPEMDKLLSDWGVTLNKDLALDLSGLGGIFQLGPEVPLVAQYESQPIVREMTRIPTAFPLTRTMEVKSGSKTTVDKLFGTTEDSVAVTNASGPIDPKKGKKGPLTLAAAGTYNGPQQGRFVVYGSSLWAQNGIFDSRSVGNRDLMLNTMNWLTSDEDLISIRPKEASDQKLNITGQRMNLLFWLTVVFFPLAVVGSGMVTWWRRR